MKNKLAWLPEIIFVVLVVGTFGYSISYFEKKTVDFILTLSCLYLLTLYMHFFVLHRKKSQTIERSLKKIETLEQLKKERLIISSSKNKMTYEQPINAIILTNKPLKKILEEINWIKCQTYSENNIRLITLVIGLIKKIPPVTDAYFLKNYQNEAYQKNQNFLKRDHLRAWKLGKKEKRIYAIAISKDTKFSIKNHNRIYSPSHSIDQNVDEQRENFCKQLKEKNPLAKITNLPIGVKVQKEEKKQYYTDGKISLIEV